MNPQPQVIIFQIQQNLEASILIIEFYKHFKTYTLFIRTQIISP